MTVILCIDHCPRRAPLLYTDPDSLGKSIYPLWAAQPLLLMGASKELMTVTFMDREGNRSKDRPPFCCWVCVTDLSGWVSLFTVLRTAPQLEWMTESRELGLSEDGCQGQRQALRARL